MVHKTNTMKKTFKFFGLVLCALLMTAGFTGCSKDDDKGLSIVGSWEFVYDDYTNIMTFRADGTGDDVEIEDGEREINSFTYTVMGDLSTGAVLYMNYYSSGSSTWTARIQGKMLYLDGDVYVKK